MCFKIKTNSYAMRKAAQHHRQTFSKYLLQQEENIVKEITTKGSSESPSQSCWLVWESPDLKNSFAQAMLQYAQQKTSSLLLIGSKQTEHPISSTIVPPKVLCENPEIFAFNPKAKDSNAIAIFLQSLLQYTFMKPSQTPLYIVFNHLEMLNQIVGLELSLAKTRKRNINFYLVSDNPQSMEKQLGKEKFQTIRDCCNFEMRRSTVKIT